MPRNFPLRDDAKTAAVLGLATGLLGAITVPFLLPSVLELAPPDKRELPLPWPLFCVALAAQSFVVYGLIALAGLRLARARHKEPAPLLSALWARERPLLEWRSIGYALWTGLACGLVLVGAIGAIKHYLPHTLPDQLHPASVWGALLASTTASIGEEIICRLFLLSLFLRFLPAARASTVLAIAASSLLFGVLHAPAAVFLFGELGNVPLLAWVWIISLNALVGIACAIWYLRIGIGGAILVHFGADLVWHVLSQLA